MTMQHARSVELVKVADTRPRALPGVVCALAGAPAGWQVRPDPRRRGSFLVLVVGTLALLAVITIVYVALGNQDNRTRAAVKKREQLEDVPSRMAEYIAGVVGDDAVAISNERNPDPSISADDEPNALLEFREAVDAPGVWYDVYSNPLQQITTLPGGDTGTIAWNRAKFNPVGTVRMDYDLQSADARDRLPGPITGVLELYNNVPPSDPWLAASEPSFLNFAGTPVGDPDRMYLYQRDWFSISNFAPDGGFVNLANLRPEYSGFNATANEMRGITIGTTNPVARKTLYDDAGLAFNDTPWGVAVDNNNAQNRPFFWTMYQSNAFRPAAIGRNEPANQTWANPSFRKYQWVDADGDGMLDSRIFEMKDAAGNGVFTDVLAFGGKYRWFFGVRAVDMSGRVNVNTAGDLAGMPLSPYEAGLPVPPGQTPNPARQTPLLTYRVGSTPADIDLERILRMTDMVSDSVASGGSWDWTSIDPTYTNENLFNIGSGAYQALRVAINTGVIPEGEDPQGSGPVYAFDGAVDQTGNNSLWDLWNRMTGGNEDAFRNTWLSNYPQFSTLATTATSPWDFTRQRRAYYVGQASKLWGEYSFGLPLTQDAVVTGSRPSFGVDDLAELLTREGVNDPKVMSALEVVLSARAIDQNPPGLPLSSVLRSQRTLDQEMGVGRARYDASIPGQGDAAVPAAGSARDLALLQMAYDPRKSLTPISSARAMRSGSRVLDRDPAFQQNNGKIEGTNATNPIMTGAELTSLAGPSATELSTDDLKVDLRASLAQTLTPRVRQNPNPTASPIAPVNWTKELVEDQQREAAMRSIFRAYADALAPYSDIRAAWPTVPPFTGMDQTLRTLFYGYNGPETALLSAAHMAVNLRDMVDTDTRPTIATVALSGQANFLGTSGSGTPGTISSRRAVAPPATGTIPYAYPAWLDADPAVTRPDRDMFRLSIESTRLAPGNANTMAPAVNVYGIEPQPFLTQVVTMAAYIDDPLQDGHAAGTDFVLNGTIPNEGDPLSGDLLFRMTAFTLTNPFDRPVTLSPAWLSDAENPVHARPTTGSLPADAGQYVPISYINGLPREQRIDTTGDYYYIQWGDKTYYLGELDHVTKVNTAPTQPNVPYVTGVRGEYIPGSSADQTDMVVVKPITIQPGRTVVCYAISRPPRAIYETLNTRFSGDDGFPLPTTTTGQKGWVESLLKGQLAETIGNENVDLRWIGLLSPGDAKSADGGQILAAEDKFYDPIPRTASHSAEITASPGIGRTVNLWRTVRSGDEALPVTNVDPGAMWNGTEIIVTPQPRVRPINVASNDQLVDRLRLPDPSDGDAGLNKMDVKAADGDNPIAGSGLDPTGSEDRPYALTLWALASRRNDRKNADPATTLADRIPSDVIPAYCIEPKHPNVDEDWNVQDVSTLLDGGGTFNVGDFDPEGSIGTVAGKGIGKMRVPDWINTMIAGGTMYDTDDPRRAPKFRTNGTEMIDEQSTVTTNITFGGPNARTYDQIYPQINSAPAAYDDPENPNPDVEAMELGVNNQLISRVRLADALLPLGIGPQETPYIGNANAPLAQNDPAAFNVRYTTLGEALAIAQGYDISLLAVPATTGPNPNPDQALLWGPRSLYAPNTSAIPEHEMLFDRGNLHLDWFVPFVDINNTGAANAFTYNAGTDHRVGQGIPAALSVLEQFTVTPDGVAPSLTRGVQGLINVNTATLAALRSVPFFAPPDIAGTLPTGTGYPAVGASEGWWNGVTGAAADPITSAYPANTAALSPFITNYNAPDMKYDLAAVLDAYRQKINVPSRRVTGEALAAAPTIGLDAINDVREFRDDDPSDETTGPARSDYADIASLSDLVGLHSVGELLAVRQRHTQSSAAAWNADQPNYWSFPLGMDWMGFDKFAPGDYTSADVESSTAAIETYSTTPAQPLVPPGPTVRSQPTVGNEYDEKLSIAAAALGTTSVRSDVYAVWFVAMGFQPSDVDACISPDDPLVPSVQRRFLMILDRSNVTKKGQKPKILLLKEVPL